MKRIVISLFTAILALGLCTQDADARRLGGGQSFGMSRNVSPQSAPLARPGFATPQATPALQPPASPGMGRWLGPIAGLAAGIGLASMLSHYGMGEGMSNILMIALLAVAAVTLFRLFSRKPQTQDSAAHGNGYTPPRYAAVAQLPSGTPIAETLNPTTASVPAGFDSAGFLRQAKLNFVRLQAANDAGNMEDIKQFSTPEFFAEVQLQYQERGRVQQQTDVVQLDAALLGISTEETRHIASVRFSGLLRESADTTPQVFEEAWHLSKPVDGSSGWVIAGIQQLA